MNLVDDFDLVIKENTEKTLDYLSKIFKKMDKENKAEIYKAINKFYTAFSVFESGVRQCIESEERKKIFNNILINYCSIINAFILEDIKVIKFLYRNTIESFLRFVLDELQTREVEGLFKEVSLMFEGELKEYLQMQSGRMKDIYKDSCLFIHADASKVDFDMSTLAAKEKKNAIKELKRLGKDFELINRAMLIILLATFPNIYSVLKENAKSYIEFIIPIDERIELKKLMLI